VGLSTLSVSVLVRLFSSVETRNAPNLLLASMRKASPCHKQRRMTEREEKEVAILAVLAGERYMHGGGANSSDLIYLL
jgi:hypothetical protein